MKRKLTPSKFSETFARTENVTTVSLYRIDCDVPEAYIFCVEERIEKFPTIMTYVGNSLRKVWKPKIQEFEGKVYEGSFGVPFFLEYIKSDLMTPPCTHYSSEVCSKEESSMLEHYISLYDTGSLEVGWWRPLRRRGCCFVHHHHPFLASN